MANPVLEGWDGEAGYRLSRGSILDHALLLQCMRRTYRELYPAHGHGFDHLAQTVEAYFSAQTPLWWVEADPATAASGGHGAARPGLVGRDRPRYVACLWMGTAVDQVSGLRHAHVFCSMSSRNIGGGGWGDR